MFMKYNFNIFIQTFIQIFIRNCKYEIPKKEVL